MRVGRITPSYPLTGSDRLAKTAHIQLLHYRMHRAHWMKRSHQIIGALHYHRQLTPFWLTQSHRTLPNSAYLAVAHISSYRFILSTALLIQNRAPKKSQPPSAAEGPAVCLSPTQNAVRDPER
jgi:hypothetical protein